MTQLGFYFDADNCIGCHTCHIACKSTHDLPVGINYRTVRTFTTGSAYRPGMYHISMACNHCASPTCLQACSASAIFRNERGLVLINADICTACGDCLIACPYQAIAVLPGGKAVKCDGCISLLDNGEAAACVASCPQRVLELGQLDGLEAAHSHESLTADAAPLPSASLTKPNLHMRLKPCMTESDFDEIII